ncbi:MAG TPA: Wzz/FepE/Etk N-terminal domain-containing protein, partial [Longimicrobium sp.]|nr:Wzz/FepE/Etk N-terminal domain-containing protein [Longimicrobium sp.]
MLPGQVSPPPYVPPAPEPVKVRELWRMVKRHRLLIGACAAVGLALGLLLVSRSRPEYQATAKILVDDNRERVARVLGTEVTDEKGRMATEMELLRSRQLAGAVADSLELRVSVVKPEGVPRSRVLSDIRLSPEADTGTITFVKQP